MDFITGLPLSTEDFNTILNVIDRLCKNATTSTAQPEKKEPQLKMGLPHPRPT
jgi:hypothetical protein